MRHELNILPLIQHKYSQKLLSYRASTDYIDLVYRNMKDLSSLYDLCSDMRKSGKNFEEKDALRKFTQLVLALEAIHDKGLIHRNLVAGKGISDDFLNQTVIVTMEGDILMGGLETAFKGDL